MSAASTGETTNMTGMSKGGEEFDDDESPSNEVLQLLEENARLRALNVELSNLLGDLPDIAWGAALTSAEAIRSIRRKIAT